MRRSVVLLLTVMLCVAVKAQREAGQWSLLPKLGVTLSKLSGESIFFALHGTANEVKTSMKPAFEAGAEVEYMTSDNIGVSLGVMFAQQGAKYKDFTSMSAPDNNVVDFAKCQDMKINMSYLNVPLMCNFYLNDRFAVKIGVQYGILLSSKFKYSIVEGQMDSRTGKVICYYDAQGNPSTGDGNVFNTKEEDIKNAYKNIDVSIPLGISYEYENVIIDARYRFGLTDIHDIDGCDRTRNSVVSLTVGYRINL